MRLDDMLKKETGSGIGVVIYGIVIILVLTLVGINILNAKIIQDGYDRLRDSLDAAAAGSVLHIAWNNDQKDEVKNISSGNYTYDYDPWLQLALGFLMKSDATDTVVGDSAIDEGETVTNDYIKFDRKRVVTHTMRVLQDGVLGTTESILNNNKYQIIMVFLEPVYNDALNRTIDIITYDSSMFINSGGNIVPNDGAGGNFVGNYVNVAFEEGAISSAITNIVNSRFASDKNYDINLGGDNSNLIEQLKTRPYYFVIIKDFALPTLFGDTQNNVFVDLTISGDGHVGPMFALQGANTKRRTAEEMEGVVK